MARTQAAKPGQPELLGGEDVYHRVVKLIQESQRYLVLATAYLKSWRHLTIALREAHERGVAIYLVVRAGDGSAREREKRKSAIEELSPFVEVLEVERLHAKVYVSEAKAIVSSMNLTASSRDSIEIGVCFEEPEFVDSVITELTRYCPELKAVRRATRMKRASPAKVVEPAEAYCIGCGSGQPYNPLRPLCMTCYRKSSRGKRLQEMNERHCHQCGAPHDASLERPLCYECYKHLSKKAQADLKALLN